MPFGNGNGPEGFGPKTGRGAGFCAGYGMPGYANDTIPRRGFGRSGGAFGGRGGFAGRGGRGRGFGAGRFGAGARGGGRGYGWAPQPGYDAPMAPPPPYPPIPEYQDTEATPRNEAEELEFLQGRLEYLKQDAQSIQERISEIQSQSEADSEE